MKELFQLAVKKLDNDTIASERIELERLNEGVG